MDAYCVPTRRGTRCHVRGQVEEPVLRQRHDRRCEAAGQEGGRLPCPYGNGDPGKLISGDARAETAKLLGARGKPFSQHRDGHVSGTSTIVDSLKSCNLVH